MGGAVVFSWDGFIGVIVLVILHDGHAEVGAIVKGFLRKVGGMAFLGTFEGIEELGMFFGGHFNDADTLSDDTHMCGVVWCGVVWWID